MTSATATHPPATQLPSRKLSVWLFLGTEIVFFAALILTYVVLRISSPNWPGLEQVQHVLNIPLTAINTFILILSSVSVVLALDAIQQGQRRGLVRWLAVTFVLGAIFLGVQAYEYVELVHHGLTITEVPEAMSGYDRHFGTTFFTMTGFHGMHVLAGLLTLAVVLLKAWRGHYTVANHDGVENFGLYWHFVDAVWIVLFTIAYILY